MHPCPPTSPLLATGWPLAKACAKACAQACLIAMAYFLAMACLLAMACAKAAFLAQACALGCLLAQACANKACFLAQACILAQACAQWCRRSSSCTSAESCRARDDIQGWKRVGGQASGCGLNVPDLAALALTLLDRLALGLEVLDLALKICTERYPSQLPAALPLRSPRVAHDECTPDARFSARADAGQRCGAHLSSRPRAGRSGSPCRICPALPAEPCACRTQRCSHICSARAEVAASQPHGSARNCKRS